MEKISYAASVIGLAAIGAMTAFNVNLSCALTLPNAAGGDPTAVQSLFDAVCPKILPLGLVLLCYWLLAKKKVNVIPLLLGLLVVAGYRFARYTTARPALTGLLFLLFGAALVAMAIALGG